MREESLFLDMDGEKVFAFLHRPEVAHGGGAILCAPLAEEMLWSRRVLVTLARELASKGYSVLRFDYRGEGDSDRDFQSSTMETRLRDTAFAIDAMHRLSPEVRDVSLVGLRLGATIAATVATSRSDVRRLVLLDPVLDGADYMHGVLRSNLMFQMAQYRKVLENREQLVERMRAGGTVNVEGYEFSAALFDQVSNLRLAEIAPRFSGPSLIAAITPRESPPRQELVDLAAACPSATLLSVVEEPFWREIKTFYQRADRLFDATLSWMAGSR